jgi:hypothetical protein
VVIESDFEIFAVERVRVSILGLKAILAAR